MCNTWVCIGVLNKPTIENAHISSYPSVVETRAGPVQAPGILLLVIITFISALTAMADSLQTISLTDRNVLPSGQKTRCLDRSHSWINQRTTRCILYTPNCGQYCDQYRASTLSHLSSPVGPAKVAYQCFLSAVLCDSHPANLASHLWQALWSIRRSLSGSRNGGGSRHGGKWIPSRIRIDPEDQHRTQA